MKRSGSAEWQGGLKDGKGKVMTQSGALDSAYSFTARFAEGQGTNPEELIAAAHAGCFSMAFAATLEKEGYQPDSIKTTADVTLEKNGDNFSIPTIHLTMHGKVSKIEDDVFQQLAHQAKENCPVSKLMKATISLEAILKK
ncbi:MAG: OsmC family peroxiredoxin [Legionella sp.]|nr:MAG: OsmC family peroxiredoxin [Legionella sp.]